MDEIIYLTVSRKKVEKMTKTLPEMRKGEIPIKLTVKVNDKAFGRPVVEQQIYVDDWTKGIDLEDVEFRKNVITDEEAQMIREKRLQKMKTILENQGYKIEEPEGEDAE